MLAKEIEDVACLQKVLAKYSRMTTTTAALLLSLQKIVNLRKMK